MPALLLRAALTARGRGGQLPATHLTRADVRVDRAELAAYNRVCRFPLTDALPPTYPHALTFPLQVALMTDRSFPLPLPGLVHIRNQVSSSAPSTRKRRWTSKSGRNGSPHRSGATVDLCATVTAAGEPVWQACSTYLARGAKLPPAPRRPNNFELGDLPPAPVGGYLLMPVAATRSQRRRQSDPSQR